MKVGIIQICSVLDYKKNLQKIRMFLEKAVAQQVKAVFLPETFYSFSDSVSLSPYLIDKGGEHYCNIKQLAKDYNVYLLGGSAATLSDCRGKAINRSYNFGPEGNDLGSYDKIHLFSCELEKDGKVKKIDESKNYIPGKKRQIIKAQDLRVGLSICVDLRYPQMFLDYVKEGANVLSISSAFTVPTGKAHWHTLVKARAIESQCFVIAAAQWGKHNEKISTYGHSLIVDPWGEILADAEEGEKLITANIDLEKIVKTRKSVKISLS
jgi:predicted amidohydrolase